ncbi:metallophosphoesterase [Mesobacillus maritimus]|uniref:metallophosphoesterase family protein n=1 Tax=Mesobacillus maritimus TaxID=1643336 RepID=UPI00203CC7E6|nr:metallophosphoesterase [Mesobacillus maritimus]MCM3585439.1 metallophosphoesterase [Mesobacillus maritimus]
MKIAVIGDLHYPSSKGLDENAVGSRDQFFSTYMDYFLNMEAAYHISVGDLTNFGTKDELNEIYGYIHPYQRSFIHTLGNHDLYSQTREEVLNQVGMKGNHSIESDEVHLVFLETAREQDFDRWDGWISEEQQIWLASEIEKSGDKLMVVFAHHPVYDTTLRSNMRMLSIEPSIDIWSILSKKKGKGIYVNGHNHMDSIVHKENWTFMQIASVLDDQSVRMLEIKDDNCQITTVYVGTEQSRQQASIIGHAIDHFQPFPEGVGTTLERNVIIPLKVVQTVE